MTHGSRRAAEHLGLNINQFYYIAKLSLKRHSLSQDGATTNIKECRRLSYQGHTQRNVAKNSGEVKSRCAQPSTLTKEITLYVPHYSDNHPSSKLCQRLCMVRMTRAAVPIPSLEVLDKFKNYDLIMPTAGNEREKEFRHCIWLGRERRTRANFTRHPSGHSAKPLINSNSLKQTRALKLPFALRRAISTTCEIPS